MLLRSNNVEYKNPISLSQYLQFHIMTRYNRNFLHDGRKLYQQWIIDQYAKVESNCLQYILLNQNNLRCETYQKVVNALQSGEIGKSGRMKILPASYTGSDCWYYNHYQDAMAVVRKYGKPTFFVTFTFDVNCPEVKRELEKAINLMIDQTLFVALFN